MKMNRLFEMVYILVNKKSVTAKELAEHFEVSIRTIYRDIDTLTSANIPIYTTQGKGGDITLLDNYVLDKSVLTEEEQNNILFALQTLTATKYMDEFEVLTKLSTLFNKSNLNWIEVDFSSWDNDKNHQKQFHILKNAILNQRVIMFEYYNGLGEKSNRVVEPTKLLFKNKAWYLKGFCLLKEEERLFKITRMTNMQLTGNTFSRKTSLNLSVNKKNPNRMVDIRLKIASGGAFRVLDDFDEKNFSKNEDGSFIVQTRLPEGDWLINYILSFGSVAEVLEPVSIRELVRESLKNTLKQYDKDI